VFAEHISAYRARRESWRSQHRVGGGRDFSRTRAATDARVGYAHRKQTRISESAEELSDTLGMLEKRSGIWSAGGLAVVN
jgi:hypothetical protein